MNRSLSFTTGLNRDRPFRGRVGQKCAWARGGVAWILAIFKVLVGKGAPGCNPPVVPCPRSCGGGPGKGNASCVLADMPITGL